MEKKRGKRSKPMEDGVWDCSVCTFKNSAEAFKCAMCDVRKGTSTRKPKPNPQLVAQQVVQQMAVVPKKATKRAAERVDLGSDTSQDSHKSESREGESSFSKANCSTPLMTSQLPSQQQASPPSVLSSSGIATPLLTTPLLTSHNESSTSRASGNSAIINGFDNSPMGGHVNFVALGRSSSNHRYHHCGEPINKSFSSIRTTASSSSPPTTGSCTGGGGSNGCTYPFYMDVTVNGVTVRIEEKDPKTINSRQHSQKSKRKKVASVPPSASLATPVPIRASSESSSHSTSFNDSVSERVSTETSIAPTSEPNVPAMSGENVSVATSSPTQPIPTVSVPSSSSPPTTFASQRTCVETSHGNNNEDVTNC